MTAGASVLLAGALATACAPGATPGAQSGQAVPASPSAPIAPAATPSAPASAGAALQCPDEPQPVTVAQLEGLLGLAARKLADAAGDVSGYPVGALADATAYDRTGARSWTSGFFPAELWMLATKDPAWIPAAQSWSTAMAQNAERTDTHDLGFMVGLPMELAAQADPERAPEYDAIRQLAARSLAQRWDPVVGAIQSGEYDGQWGVIVDSAMNMPLLIRAGQEIGGPDGDELQRRGTDHLRFLIANFIRPDGTTAHRQVFDTATGQSLGEIAGQGEGPGSTWARGQAWAVHGFADAYALTQDPQFLDAAQRTAEAYMARVPAGCIPPWDLDLVEGPPDTPLDASAAAIVSDGLLVLAEHEPDAQRAAAYHAYARTTLGTLMNARSLTDGSTNPGLLLRQTYNVNADARSGSYVWGDAYLLLAALRLQG